MAGLYGGGVVDKLDVVWIKVCLSDEQQRGTAVSWSELLAFN